MLNRGRCFFLCSILLGVFAPLCFAAPRLKVEPPAGKVALGQSVVLKLQLEWTKDEGPYEINSLEPKLENLILESQNQSQETGETVSQTLLYKFRPLKAGKALIYPFEIIFRKTETDLWIPILIPEQKIRVVSNFPFTAALIGLGIVAGLSLGIVFGFKQWELWKTRVAARNAPPVDPKQRIYAQAEEAITKFDSPHPREKLTHWANQLRIVVATYYDVSRVATPNEILSFLKIKGIPAGDWNEISRLFEQLSELQFSRHDISAYDLARMQRTLLQYVTGKIIIGNL